MKPVEQRSVWAKPGDHGDCMNACLASLLEVPYEDVPFFKQIEDEDGSWHQALFTFLDAKGFEFKGSFYPKGPVDNRLGPNFGKPLYNWHELDSPGVDGFFMAYGTSLRNAPGGHAVIINAKGELVHDPHPAKNGVGRYTSVNLIERKPADGKE